MTKPVLELTGISVSFGPVQALRDVDFAVNAGEVVALVGDNGAGKSTLVKVMAGIRPADSGEIRVCGQLQEIATPKDAAALGISTVFQDLALCDDLDIVANLYLGREKTTRLGTLDDASMERRAAELLASLNVTTVKSLHMKVAQLSGGQRQSVAVARSIIGDPTTVLLDEPTAALGVAQRAEVLALVRRLKEHGIGVVLVSHNMHDVLEVADRIHVLRLGRTNGKFVAKGCSSEKIVAAITGATIIDEAEVTA